MAIDRATLELIVRVQAQQLAALPALINQASSAIGKIGTGGAGMATANTQAAQLANGLVKVQMAAINAQAQLMKLAVPPAAGANMGGMAGLGGMAALGGTAAGITAGLKKATDASIDFDSNMRNVNTIARFSEESFQGMRKAILDMAGSAEVGGKGAIDLSEALYDIFSTGVGTNRAVSEAENVAEAMNFLQTAALGARGGLTTTKDAANGLLSVFQSYNQQGDPAAVQRSLDVLFETVNKGRITFPQLAQGIGITSTTAKQMGMTIEELGATIATITAKSNRPQQAMYGLDSVLMSIRTPGKVQREIMDTLRAFTGDAGLTFDLAKMKAQGFVPWLLKVIDAMEDYSEATGIDVQTIESQFIPEARALRNFAQLTDGSARLYVENLEAMTNATALLDGPFKGMRASVAAYSEQLKSTRSFQDIMASSIERLQIVLGDVFRPTVEATAAIVTTLTNGLSLLGGGFLGVGGMGLASIGGILGVATAMRTVRFAGQVLGKELDLLKVKFLGLMRFMLMGPGLVLLPLIAAFALLNTNWFGTIKNGTKLTQIFDALGDIAKIVTGELPSAGAALRLAFGDSAAVGIARFFATIRDAIGSVIEMIGVLTGAAPDAGQALTGLVGQANAKNIMNTLAVLREFAGGFGNRVNPKMGTTVPGVEFDAAGNRIDPEAKAIRGLGFGASGERMEVPEIGKALDIDAIRFDTANADQFRDNLKNAAASGASLADSMRIIANHLNDIAKHGFWDWATGNTPATRAAKDADKAAGVDNPTGPWDLGPDYRKFNREGDAALASVWTGFWDNVAAWFNGPKKPATAGGGVPPGGGGPSGGDGGPAGGAARSSKGRAGQLNSMTLPPELEDRASDIDLGLASLKLSLSVLDGPVNMVKGAIQNLTSSMALSDEQFDIMKQNVEDALVLWPELAGLTFDDMLKSLQELRDVASKLFDGLFLQVEPVIGFFDPGGPLGQAFSGFGTFMQAIWSTIAEIFTTTWTNMQLAATAIWNTISGIATEVWTNMQLSATAIWTKISEIATTTWTNMQLAATAIWNTISSIWTEMWSNMQKLAERVWLVIVDIWNKMSDNMRTTIGGFFDWLGTTAQTWVGPGGIIGTFFSNFGTFVRGIWNGLFGEQPGSFRSTVGGFFDALGTKVNEWLGPGGIIGTHFSNFGTLVRGIWDGLFGPTGFFTTTVGPWFETLGKTINDWFGPDGKIGKAFAAFGTTMEDMLKPGGSIGLFFSSFGTRARSVGTDIVSGLVQGIRDAWGSIVATLRELGKDLPEPIKRVLGISSPSTVFAAIGEEIPHGIALGIRRGAGDMTDALASIGLGSDLTAQAQTTVRVEVDVTSSDGSVSAMNLDQVRQVAVEAFGGIISDSRRKTRSGTGLSVQA